MEKITRADLAGLLKFRERLPLMGYGAAHNLVDELIAQAQEAPEAEPVELQCREIGESGWEPCSKERFGHCERSPHHDTRKLYTHPAPAQPSAVPEGHLLLTTEQVARHTATAWECPPQSRVILVSSLERLARKNAAAPHPQQPDAGGLLEAIQAAVNGVRAPDDMTKAKAEYFKAGARAAVHAVNNALAAYRAQQGGSHLAWAVERWRAEVSQRPLVNVHRRALDGTWRQVIHRLGGDPDALCGPSHDELRAKQGGGGGQ